MLCNVVVVVAVYLSIYLSVCLSICLSASLKMKLSCETSSMFWLDNVKTQEFCETSSSFERGKVKNEEILGDFLKKMESWVQSWRPHQCNLRFFQSMCLKYCACHEKVMPGHTKPQNHLSKPKDAPKMQHFSGNQRPDLLTSLMNMSLVSRLPREMHLCRSSWHVPRLPLF